MIRALSRSFQKKDYQNNYFYNTKQIYVTTTMKARMDVEIEIMIEYNKLGCVVYPI